MGRHKWPPPSKRDGEYVVWVGEFRNGFVSYGPFDCLSDAIEWYSDPFGEKYREHRFIVPLRRHNANISEPGEFDDKYIACVGDLSCGWKVFGPFDSFDNAYLWYSCDSEYSEILMTMDCWIASLHSPFAEERV